LFESSTVEAALNAADMPLKRQLHDRLKSIHHMDVLVLSLGRTSLPWNGRLLQTVHCSLTNFTKTS
jgi:hypothetical protein